MITKGTAMLIKGNANGQRSLLTQAMGAAALAMMLAACSATSSTQARTTGTPPSAGTPTAATAAASTTAASSVAASSVAVATAAASSTASPASRPPSAAASGLSGTWPGQYSGASQGDFTLHWTQSGSALSGTVSLETNGITMPIHGTVAGDSIKFGTVGSTGISYQGTVSGNSMSGTYQLAVNGTTFTGPWTATRSS
jgi:hypothetical protein